MRGVITQPVIETESPCRSRGGGAKGTEEELPPVHAEPKVWLRR